MPEQKLDSNCQTKLLPQKTSTTTTTTQMGLNENDIQIEDFDLVEILSEFDEIPDFEGFSSEIEEEDAAAIATTSGKNSKNEFKSSKNSVNLIGKVSSNFEKQILANENPSQIPYQSQQLIPEQEPVKLSQPNPSIQKQPTEMINVQHATSLDHIPTSDMEINELAKENINFDDDTVSTNVQKWCNFKGNNILFASHLNII